MGGGKLHRNPASLTLGVTVARPKTQIPGIFSSTFIILTFRFSIFKQLIFQFLPYVNYKNLRRNGHIDNTSF